MDRNKPDKSKLLWAALLIAVLIQMLLWVLGEPLWFKPLLDRSLQPPELEIRLQADRLQGDRLQVNTGSSGANAALNLPVQSTVNCDATSCPNVVLVILDDMPWDHFQFLSGQAHQQTPNLDAIAQQGFVFSHAYKSSSRCRASLATVLTGQLPHQNQIYANQGVHKLFDQQSLPLLLRQAGYETFAGGKMWEGNPEFFQFSDHDLDTLHFVRTSQDKLDAFLDQHGGRQPLFIWWAPLLPHLTHNAPDGFVQRFDASSIPVPEFIVDTERENYRKAERDFLATIAWVDDEVGRLMNALKQRQLEQNTWVFIFSDNGWSNAVPAKGAAQDMGVRTPLMILGPGVQAGRSDELLSMQNLYANVLGLAGLQAAGARAAAVDLIARAKNPAADGDAGLQDVASSNDQASMVFWASYPAYTGKSEPDPRAGRDVYALSLRDGPWQYTLYLKDMDAVGNAEGKAPARIHDTGFYTPYHFAAGDQELFDLQQDPYSQHNLASQHADRLVAYRESVIQWWRNSGGGPIDALIQ